MQTSTKPFLPAAGHDFALFLYDPLTKLFGAERARRVLIEQASLAPEQRVLDIGCGTGSLILLAQRLHPDVTYVGLDPDPKAIARSRNKAQRRGGAARFDQGYANALPYPDASFDRVFSSFMLHHLPTAERLQALREVARVLTPGGSLHLLDFAVPQAAPTSRQAFVGGHMRADLDGSIVELLETAGLSDARELTHARSFFQSIVYYRASAPGQRAPR